MISTSPLPLRPTGTALLTTKVVASTFKTDSAGKPRGKGQMRCDRASTARNNNVFLTKNEKCEKKNNKIKQSLWKKGNKPKISNLYSYVHSFINIIVRRKNKEHQTQQTSNQKQHQSSGGVVSCPQSLGGQQKQARAH